MRIRRIYDDPPSVRRRNLFNWNSTGQMALNPLTLFLNGEVGVWYDPSDFSTMFQDSAGTTPVTAVEQPVGKILDKSGRGNHASQATTTKRPLLRQDGNGKYYLYFDGVDDALATSAINFTATDKMTVFAGVRKLIAQNAIVVESSANYSANAGSFIASSGIASGHFFGMRGTAPASYSSTFTAPQTSVQTLALDIGAAAIATELKPRINGSIPTLVISSAGPAGTGNFGNYPLYIGSRAGTTSPFNGHIYSLIVRGAESTTTQIVSTETYVNSKTGAY